MRVESEELEKRQIFKDILFELASNSDYLEDELKCHLEGMGYGGGG